MTHAMAISAWAPLPIGAVARWALICVFAAVIIVPVLVRHAHD